MSRPNPLRSGNQLETDATLGPSSTPDVSVGDRLVLTVGFHVATAVLGLASWLDRHAVERQQPRNHHQIRSRIGVPPSAVYRALVDADAIARWRVPTGMAATIHEFDPREGGQFRISLTYDVPTERGKTTAQTDTYHGNFVRLIPDERVVEELEFETPNPDLQGRITVTTALTAVDGGTEVGIEYEGLPRGVSVADNETGTRMALDKLAAHLEHP
jgi:uncharacterized protein YndB with AHSA1/START domain